MRTIILTLFFTYISINAVTAAPKLEPLVSATTFNAALIQLTDKHPLLILAEKNETIKTPTRGMTMRKVKRLFGKPEKEIPSAGKPPITRWVYKDFTVYFEGKNVIHAVKKSPLSSNNPA